MKRLTLVLAVLLLAGPNSHAADLQKALKSRWLGAWVVTTVESYSDCNGVYTNNRVNGMLVKSAGQEGLEAGELAKLDRVDAKRSRLDLHLSLAEPVLLAYQDGPFTLYREAHCRIELQLELPRSVVKSGDVAAVEDALAAVLERHATEASARSSAAWNAREVDDYPADYERTLAEHRRWQADRTNDAVQAQLDRAYAATVELSYRVQAESEYTTGFARGVEDARGEDLTSCPRLLAVDLGSFKRLAAQVAEKDPGAGPGARGFQDGRQLVYGLELIARLPGCFVATEDDGTAD